MAISDFFESMKRMVAGKEDESRLSRRDMLSGIGLFGALAVAGPTLLSSSAAEAVEIIDTDEDADTDLTEVSSRRRKGRRRSSRRRLRSKRRRLSRRRPKVRRRTVRRPRVRRRRFAYGDIYHRCRYDRRFRYRNPGLCERVLYGHRPRPGACFSFRIDGIAASFCG